jgi:DNA-directed RNA polymerase subunit RPC12/RpoP
MGNYREGSEIPECADCERKGIFLTTYRCEGIDVDHNRETQCTDRVCPDCLYQVVIDHKDEETRDVKNFCEFHFKRELMNFTLKILKEVHYHDSYFYPDGSELSFTGADVEDLIERAIQKKVKKRKEQNEREKQEKLERAHNLEDAGRYEDAAKLYEELEMWKHAGKARRRLKESVTKHIHIDANDLFKQIKTEGLSVPYKCPNCSGTLKIDGRKRFDECPYCGTDIDFKTLSDLVDTLLN